MSGFLIQVGFLSMSKEDVLSQAELHFRNGVREFMENIPFAVSLEIDEILIKSRKLLQKEGWIQGDFVRQDEGYCVTGALGACTPHEPGSLLVYAAEMRLAKTLGIETDDLPEWNDHPDRYHHNVAWWLSFAVENDCQCCDNLADIEGCNNCSECCKKNHGIPEKYDLDGEMVYEDHCHVHCELLDCDCWSAI